MYICSAFRVLLENDEDRLLVVFNRGLILMTEVRLISPYTPNTVHILYYYCTHSTAGLLSTVVCWTLLYCNLLDSYLLGVYCTVSVLNLYCSLLPCALLLLTVI